MKEQHTYNNIENLLPRYCEGLVTPEEREAVEAWIRQSDEHYKIAKQIHLLYLASDTLGIMEHVDSAKALKKVNVRICSRRVDFVIAWMQRIAAVLFIPLLIAYLVQVFTFEEKTSRMLEVRTNPGMTTHFVLPDGTKVDLNSGSSLVYPEAFAGDVRQVRLEGEAFFEVTKDPKKRFIVETPHDAHVEVLGTSFNLETFECDSFISTTLVQGKVEFVTKSGNIRLKQGEKLIYDVKNDQTNVFQTTGESETAWINGKIVFRNTSFEEALRMLEKRYYVEFIVVNSQHKNDAFTGSFREQRLDRILEVFKVSSGINWRYLPTEDKSGEKSRIEIY